MTSSAKMTEESPESLDFVVCPSSISLGNLASNVLSNPGVVNNDLSFEEIHQYLSKVLKENLDLKDALERNNCVMQEQLLIVAAWRSQLIETNSNLKAALKEEQKSNQKLREENECFHLKIKALETKNKSYEEQECTSKCVTFKEEISSVCKESNKLELTENSTDNGLEKDQILREFEKSMQGISVELDNLRVNNRFLEEEKWELIALNNQLQYKLSMLGTAETDRGKDQEPIIFNDEESGYAIVVNPNEPYDEKKIADIRLKDLLLCLKEEQVKVLNLTQELAKEKMQVAYLRKMVGVQSEKVLLQKDLAIFSQTAPLQKSDGDLKGEMCLQHEQDDINCVKKSEVIDTVSLKKSDTFCHSQAEEDLKKELELTIQKLQDVTSCMHNYKDSYDNLQCQNDELQKQFEKIKAADKTVIEQLQTDLKFLQNALSQERAANLNERTISTLSQSALAELSREYQKVLNKLHSMKTEQDMKEEFVMQAESQNLKHVEELDSLTAQLVNSEQQLEEQQKIVKNLNQKIAGLQESLESLPILKAQVEVYKSDYEKENTARKALAAKLNECEALVASLQAQLLTEQVQSNKGPCSSVGNHSLVRKIKTHSSPGETHRSKAPTEKFQCPRCFLLFTKFAALQNHVECCIGDDSYI